MKRCQNARSLSLILRRAPPLLSHGRDHTGALRRQRGNVVPPAQQHRNTQGRGGAAAVVGEVPGHVHAAGRHQGGITRLSSVEIVFRLGWARLGQA